MCWVKIQERKMLKFSKLTVLHISESNFQEEAPYLLRPPPTSGGWHFITVLLGCTDLLYCTVLLYCLIRIFFSSLYRYFFGVKYPHTPSLDKLLCQIFIRTEFCEISFLLFSYIYCIERHD